MATDCAVMPSTESTGRSTTESGAAGAADGNQDHRELPDLAVEAALVRKAPHDRVRAAQPVQPLVRSDELSATRISDQRRAALDPRHDPVDPGRAVDQSPWPLLQIGLGDGNRPGTARGRSCANRPARPPSAPGTIQPSSIRRSGSLRLRAQAADGQPRAGERMPLQQLLRQAQLAAHLAHLVLVERG